MSTSRYKAYPECTVDLVNTLALIIITFNTNRYNQWVSLLAALMCVALMFAMEWVYALVTVCFLGVLAVYILWRCVFIRFQPVTTGIYNIYNIIIDLI